MFKVSTSYIVYWTVGSIFVGILLAPLVVSTQAKMDHSTHSTHDHMMAHGQINVDPANVPTIEIEVRKDAMSGWNLSVMTDNFRFTPEDVNQPNVPNQGHAHIYIDGVKLTRLYSKTYYLADLLPGEHEISVGLNANDHSDYAMSGEPILARTSIVQADK